MSKKNYSVARVVTHTQSTIGKCERHNERKNESYANMNVDTARCDMNVHFKGCDELTYNEQLNKLIDEKKVCMRGLKADANVFDEMIFDVNTDYFETHGGYEYAKEFYEEAYRFSVALYGEQNIISAVMHADELNVALTEQYGNMSYHTNTVNKDIHYFSCSNYVKDTRGTCQARHYIRADALEQIVVFELKRLAKMLQHDEKHLAEILEKKTHKDFYYEKKFLEGELQKAIVRQQSVASLYEKLYEDNATGKVTDEWFTHMSHKYEVERAELKVKIFNLREKVANMQTVQHSKDMFIGAVKKFLDMETITAPLIHELIDHIDVYEAEGKGKNKTQRVVIHYNFVGYLEIPENDEPCFTADTRQGVAIGYIAKPTEKSA